jgi:hypothetical protein
MSGNGEESEMIDEILSDFDLIDLDPDGNDNGNEYVKDLLQSSGLQILKNKLNKSGRRSELNCYFCLLIHKKSRKSIYG